MKLLKIYFSIILLIITACSAAGSEDNLKIVSFDTSITCDHCKTVMFDNLPKEKGVIDLKVNVEEKTVTILFNNKTTTIEKLAENISELGYSTYVKSVKVYSGNFDKE